MSPIFDKLFGLRSAGRWLIPHRSVATSGVNNKASLDQLIKLEENLVVHLPKFFASPHPFNLYTPDVILIDNIRSLRTEGISQYAMQVSLIKLYHFLNYTSMKVELLNLVKNPEESYLRIRWRIITKPGLIQFALFFWKIKSLESWKDGISTMHVNKEGKIYCHVCDNIDAELENIGAKDRQSLKNPLVNRGLNV